MKYEPGLPARATMSIPAAAAKLGLSVRTLYVNCKRGRFPCVRVVGRVLILQETVDQLLAGGMLPPKSTPSVQVAPDGQVVPVEPTSAW